MNPIPIYQVDAFADRVFAGNPAAVCPLDGWLPDELLLAIANENNLSETAFVDYGQVPPRIRWFTPTQEVPLCGHATLAAGHVHFHHVEPSSRAVIFLSGFGPLTLTRLERGIGLDVPHVDLVEVTGAPDALVAGLGVEIDALLETPRDPNYLVIVDSPTTVAELEPDLTCLGTLHPRGVGVSAADGADRFVSRYFAPSYGIGEDPATGSVQAALAGHWAARLGRTTLSASQLSRRGASFDIEVHDRHVRLIGRTHLYLEGQLYPNGHHPSEKVATTARERTTTP